MSSSLKLITQNRYPRDRFTQNGRMAPGAPRQCAGTAPAYTTSDEANILACLIAQVESRVRVKVARIRTHEVERWQELTVRAGLHIDLIIRAHLPQDLKAVQIG
jgi:hypothetical protein